MASNMEQVAVTSQKHDPAWKHCQMFKIGDKVQLKCIYCGKIFKGGGIHRIKEHLACQKGNAAVCLRVKPDVQLEMLESLNGVAVKKRKKQKLAEEMTGYNNNPSTSMIEVGNNTNCGINTEIVLLPVPEMIENDEDEDEDGMSSKTSSRKKKGRVRKAQDVVNSNPAPLAEFPTTNLKTVHMAVGRFFSDVGLPPNAVNSAYFKPMIDAIASYGTGLVGPSYHDLRSWISKNIVNEVRTKINKCTDSWEKSGCSILVDEYCSSKGKTFVNFFAYSPEGTIFLRSSDISRTSYSSDVLYELLKEIVEEIGLKNVLQVITSSDDRYLVAGKRLTDTYPTIFWTPCAGRLIDLMLSDITELLEVKTVMDQAKSISKYLHSKSVTINMMRRYGVDLVEIGPTRSSTDFLTLKRMVNNMHNLHSMVTSQEWMESAYSKKSEGDAVLDFISSESFWSNCGLITRLVDPILRLLRIVSSEKIPAMGFVYAGLYRVKESIKKELVDKEKYLVYWGIIDRRWEQLHRHPLHAAGFYLNPKYFYSLEGDAHLHIRSLVYDCIEKLVPDAKVQDKIMKETASYHGGAGDFGRQMAVRARDTLHPTEWWDACGGGCPNLGRLAVRILSQTCCLFQHKLDKIPLEQMHERKNCLEQQRLNDLVFAQYNMSMKQMLSGNRQNEPVDPISYEHISLVEDWVMEKELCSESSLENSEWMAIDDLDRVEPLGNLVQLGPQIDDLEALGAGFDDFEIFEGVKDSEDETGDENIGNH